MFQKFYAATALFPGQFPLKFPTILPLWVTITLCHSLHNHSYRKKAGQKDKNK